MAGLTAFLSPRGLRSRAIHDGLIVTIGGQIERVLGIFAALTLRWGLAPEQLGIYTGLRLYLDNTNRSSLGISLGAVQEIPVLRGAGKFDEAQKVANVAHTTNTVTCLFFALGLLIWAMIRSATFRESPLAAEWTRGLVAIAGLAILKRYQDFQISVLRAYQEFSLTTRLGILDGLLSGVLMPAGIWIAGLWGLLASVGLLLSFNIAYLYRTHELRLTFVWDKQIALRLMLLGLPILANTTAFGLLQTMDRWIILGLITEGERAAGYYSLALIGTSWSVDIGGRIAIVAYTYFQTTLGKTNDPEQVAEQAIQVTNSQAKWLGLAGAWVYLLGPDFLAWLIPKYSPGTAALRPLLPGMILLALSWPTRQMLITIGKPLRLLLATCIALGLTCGAALIGSQYSGIVGVAWGMSVGYASCYLFTHYAAFGMSRLHDQVGVILSLSIMLISVAVVRIPLVSIEMKISLLALLTTPWSLPLLRSLMGRSREVR